jgi:hypothetical protein
MEEDMANLILNRNPEEDDLRSATDEQLAFIDLTNEVKSMRCFTCDVDVTPQEAEWCRELGHDVLPLTGRRAVN